MILFQSGQDELMIALARSILRLGAERLRSDHLNLAVYSFFPGRVLTEPCPGRLGELRGFSHAKRLRGHP